MDNIKSNIKKFLSKKGFKKVKGCFVKHIERGFYLIVKVHRQANYTYYDNAKSEKSGLPYYVNTELPFYDILIIIRKLSNTADVIDEDPDCSICDMSLTPKMQWVRVNDESEARIISEMKLAFEKVCYNPLFSDVKPDFSIYKYVLWMYKVQNTYLHIHHMIWLSKLAFEYKKYSDALLWLKRIVINYNMDLPKTTLDFVQGEKDFVSDKDLLNMLDEIMSRDFSTDYIDKDIEKYIKNLYFQIKDSLS